LLTTAFFCLVIITELRGRKILATFLNYPEQYKGDVLSEAFATEFFELIEIDGRGYWI
jgi:hypothetical protein